MILLNYEDLYFGEQSLKALETQPVVLSSLTNYHVFGITVPSASPVEEISKSLEQGVRTDGLAHRFGNGKRNRF